MPKRSVSAPAKKPKGAAATWGPGRPPIPPEVLIVFGEATDLSTPASVRAEMVRVYQMKCRGELLPSVSSRALNELNNLHKCMIAEKQVELMDRTATGGGTIGFAGLVVWGTTPAPPRTIEHEEGKR